MQRAEGSVNKAKSMNKLKNWGKVIRQFAKEFWIPFLCALAYVLWGRYWPSTGFGPALKDFGLAFFFVSWFSGNVVRIWRTDKTQTALNDIKAALADYAAASSKATEASNALLQEVATSVRPGAGRSDPLVEMARLSVQANNQLTTANNAVISVISSSLTPASIRGLYPAGMTTITEPSYDYGPVPAERARETPLVLRETKPNQSNND
jgi:hypothetical protein